MPHRSLLLQARRSLGRRGLQLALILAVFAGTRALAWGAALLADSYGSPSHATRWERADSDLHGGAIPGPAIEPLLRWDALFYVALARSGYPPPRTETVYHANFFPLYPLLVRAVERATGDTFSAAFFVSNLCALAAALLLARLAEGAEGARLHDGARAALLFLCFPGSHFLSLPYTEGLCALAICAGLLALQRERPWLAGLCGAVASGTRAAGLALAAALLVRAWEQRRSPSQAASWLGGAVLACGGTVGYSVFCLQRFGDPLYWVHSQAAFGRRLSLLGPLKGLFAFDADPSFYAVTLVCIAALLLLLRRMPRPQSAAAWFLLLVPLATGTMKSMIRYQSIDLALFAWAPRLLRGRRLTIALAAGCALMLIEMGLYTLDRPHN